MARKRAARKGNTNQSKFIRDLFAAARNTELGDAKKAWAAAGNKSTLGNSLFYVVKRKAGFSKPSKSSKRGGRPPGTADKTAQPTRTSTNGYEAVEDRLDEV